MGNIGRQVMPKVVLAPVDPAEAQVAETPESAEEPQQEPAVPV